MPQNLLKISPAQNVLICLSHLDLPSSGRRQRDVEDAAVMRMLNHLLGSDVTVAHNSDGKPIIEGFELSISHTRGLAAVMLAKGHKVGIDVEYDSPRVGKIASRFLRNDENAPTIRLQLLHWCAKEAVFKLFSESNLAYQQMRVNSVDDDTMEVWAEGCGTVTCHYKFQNGFCLVYVWL